MIKYIYYLILLLFIYPQNLVAKQPYTLTIPAPLNGSDGRNEYVEVLLKNIFSAQGYELNIKYSFIPANKIRSAQLLSQNNKIDLFWRSARTDIDPALQAIEYPIYKGYLGYRLLLIHSNSSSQFSSIYSKEELATFTAVQKKDWLDYKILTSNGLTVESDMTFPAMFKAVDQELINYFPRSIVEIDRELMKFGAANIIIASDIMIKYPTASYFYVNEQNKELATIMQLGFKKVYENGVFDDLFNQYFRHIINKHQLDNRKIIELTNPYLVN